MNPRALYVPGGDIFVNLTVMGSLFGANGQTIIGNSAGAWAITANGTNQSITLTPSGSGAVVSGSRSFLGATGGRLNIGTADGSGVNILVNSAQVARFSDGTGNLLLAGLGTDGTGALQFPAATTAAGGITFGTDTNFYRVSSNYCRLSTNLECAAGFFVSYNNQTGLRASASDLIVDAGGGGRVLLNAGGATGIFVENTQNATFATLTQNFGGSAGAASTRTAFQKAVTAIANAAATAVLTITVPNAAHSASVRVRVVGALGAGGAIGAGEATGTIAYDIAIARTAGVNAVATISAAFGSATSSVAGAATITVAAAMSAVAGAVGATNTFTVNVTITRGSGASTNHTCQVAAEVVNANATGVTVA